MRACSARSRAATSTRGFSLIELMIAVMILGLGMVMVATVFPVSLDMTRETLQMQISNAAVDAAVQTLKLKVPAFENLETIDTGVFLKMRFPNALIGPEWGVAAVEDNAEIETGAEATLYSNPVLPIPDFGSRFLPPAPPLWQGGTPIPWIPFTHTYTEVSFWDAELVVAPFIAGGGTIDGVRANTWVMQSQNILSDTKAVVSDAPPYIDLVPGVTAQAPPRVQLIDRVYPPLQVYYDYAGDVYYETDPLNPPVPRILSVPDVVQQVFRQRYAWHVIHSLSSLYLGSGSLLSTIVVTHRGDLNARYPRQGPAGSALVFDLTNTATVNNLRSPVTAGPNSDTVFPQPWLVVVDDIVPGTGTVVCTPFIARLLPAGSVFIVARTGTVGVPPGFEAGTPHKVLGNPYDISSGSSLVTLQLARSSGAAMGLTAIWVFPPPIRVHATRVFEPRTPVVGAFVREVTP